MKADSEKTFYKLARLILRRWRREEGRITVKNEKQKLKKRIGTALYFCLPREEWRELKRLSQKNEMKIWAFMQTLPDDIVAVYVNYAKEYLREHRRVVWK